MRARAVSARRQDLEEIAFEQDVLIMLSHERTCERFKSFCRLHAVCSRHGLCRKVQILKSVRTDMRLQLERFVADDHE